MIRTIMGERVVTHQVGIVALYIEANISGVGSLRPSREIHILVQNKSRKSILAKLYKFDCRVVRPSKNIVYLFTDGSTSGILGLGPSRENHIFAKSQSKKLILAK